MLPSDPTVEGMSVTAHQVPNHVNILHSRTGGEKIIVHFSLTPNTLL
jgi:hypothetical protein